MENDEELSRICFYFLASWRAARDRMHDSNGKGCEYSVEDNIEERDEDFLDIHKNT